MEIVVRKEGSPAVVAIEGRLDTTTSPQLEQFVEKLHDQGAHDIVIDMEGCEFVSSAGLRAIVSIQKRATMGGSLAFRNVSADVMDVFTMTGFKGILTIE